MCLNSCNPSTMNDGKFMLISNQCFWTDQQIRAFIIRLIQNHWLNLWLKRWSGMILWMVMNDLMMTVWFNKLIMKCHSVLSHSAHQHMWVTSLATAKLSKAQRRGRGKSTWRTGKQPRQSFYVLISINMKETGRKERRHEDVLSKMLSNASIIKHFVS